MVTQKEIDRVYKKYKDVTNMSYIELFTWSKNPTSKEASLSREPIIRNLRLLKKPKKEWTAKDVRDANKTISYLARAKKIKRAKGTPKNVLTRNEKALRNWAFDVFKK